MRRLISLNRSSTHSPENHSYVDGGPRCQLHHGDLVGQSILMVVILSKDESECVTDDLGPGTRTVRSGTGLCCIHPGCSRYVHATCVVRV